MADQGRSPSISPSRRRVQISPERHVSTSYKNLSYTPQKLENSYMYKEVTINKKVEIEKNVIRELQSLNALLQDKIGHLTLEHQTMRIGYEKQIQMYKRMLRQQEQQTKRLIKNLQLQFSLEIEKVLQTHEQDAKVAQAEKQQLQARIQQLLSKILELQGHINHGTNTINDLTSQLNLTSQKLLNTENKLLHAQEDTRRNNDRLNREVNNLNNKIIQNQVTYKQQLQTLNNAKNRQIDNLNRLHLTELDKIDAKRDVEIKAKILQMEDIKAIFGRQTSRLEDIINNKDRVNETLALQLRKEKERVIVLTRNYDLEIGKLVNQKDHILSDLAVLNDDKIIMEKELCDMGLLFDAQRGRNAAVVNTLQGQIEMKNIELVKENERLLRAINQYEKELALVSHSANAVNKTLQIERSEQVRRLVLQIRNLKQILLQSSSQMDKCKQQFLRLELQKDQLIRINRECQAQSIRLRSLISQQDLQLRFRRI